MSGGRIYRGMHIVIISSVYADFLPEVMGANPPGVARGDKTIVLEGVPLNEKHPPARL